MKTPIPPIPSVWSDDEVQFADKESPNLTTTLGVLSSNGQEVLTGFPRMIQESLTQAYSMIQQHLNSACGQIVTIKNNKMINLAHYFSSAGILDAWIH